MNFLQLKLIFDSFSRSSFLVAISARTLQDGANESAESLQQTASERPISRAFSSNSLPPRHLWSHVHRLLPQLSCIHKRHDRDGIISNYFRGNRNANAFGISVCFRLRTINLHAALEISAILNADPSRCNIADHRAILLNLDSVASMKIALDLAVDNDFACGDFGIQLSGASYGQPSALKRDRTLNFAIDLQIFFARDLALNREGCPQGRHIARRRTIRAHRSGCVERSGWRFRPMRRRCARWFRLRLLC